MKLLLKRKGRYYTKALVPGSVYEEPVITISGNEYREWSPKRSKLGAGLRKGVRNPVKDSSFVLYLGAASGTTVSHVSDLTPKGRVYAVEFAPEPMKHLVLLAKKRANIIPLFANANKPGDYPVKVEPVSVVFQDIAQKNQVQIFRKNCKAYLKKDGTGLITVKARSIDSTKKPSIVFKAAEKELRKDFKILKQTRLEPYEKDHKIYVLKLK
ncbi:fibrillarin-like rRNA/tRNA 2'-O-methyltransferase [archaeon]|nr:fibrillarin-like rRNA/tRNA 2'-O-methyltransferase [archaeon]